ncbi:hypothetical protein CSKR_203629 [Clonorchis sinensis]|uniref:Uncharacterized protein n=1 Tax=Clonorchis sinensis TaxID=79923 RepID=A0A8T1MUT8_CLOSI|nr:hypothetical protein CSKR_203629 [Clonorchis sinensis]
MTHVHNCPKPLDSNNGLPILPTAATSTTLSGPVGHPPFPDISVACSKPVGLTTVPLTTGADVLSPKARCRSTDLFPDLHCPGIASRSNLPDCEADLCPGDSQTYLTTAGPASSTTQVHEPSTSTFGHLPTRPLTSTAPTKFIADRTGAASHQPLTGAAIVSESTFYYSRPLDLMTIRFSPPKRFSGLKHLLLKPCIITPSPVLTS